MSSKITTEKYDLVRIEKLKHFLESNQQSGRPKFYEVFVDNLKVVDKTSDPTVFDNYLVYMGDDTRMVKVLIYTSTENCPRNDKFIFTVRDTQQENRHEELSGIEVENRINTAIEKERANNHLQVLQKELEQARQKLQECEEYNDELEEKLTAVETEFEAFRKKKISFSEMNTGKLVGFATDYFMKNYPSLSSKVPLISALSGFLTESDGEQQLPDMAGSNEASNNTTQATFSKKESSTSTSAPALDLATQRKLIFFEQMEAAFSEKQMEKVIEIIQQLAADTSQVDTIHELLHPSTTKQS